MRFTRFRLRLPAGFILITLLHLVITAPGLMILTRIPHLLDTSMAIRKLRLANQVTTPAAADVISIAGLQVRATGVGSGNIIRVASTGPGSQSTRYNG